MRRCPATFRAVAPLGWLGVLLLAVSVLALAPAWHPPLQIAARARAEAQVQLAANALALQAGIAGLTGRAVAEPIDAAVRRGLVNAIERLPPGAPDVLAAALLAPGGEVLWLRAPTAAPAAADGLPPGPRVFAPVMRDGVPFARVVVVWRPRPLAGIVAPWLPPLAVWLLTLALLACEALKLSWSRGLLLREVQLQTACRLINAGDFNWWMLPLRRRAFDGRLARLNAGVRNLNEMHRRVRHLGESLRNTEVDAGRRAELESILREASGGDSFAVDQIPPEMSLPAGARPWRWRALLRVLVLGAGAALPWLAVSGLARDAGLEPVLDVALVLAFVALGALVCASWRLPGRGSPAAARPHRLKGPRAA